MIPAIRVIGGGLAGCEAAWQAARFGARVTLIEMRPARMTGAHATGRLAELVCSNSLRAISIENAVGLLKEEMSRFGSLIVDCARAAAVPAGGALAVDRERFSALVEERIAAHPSIEIKRQEATRIDPGIVTIVACGPLASHALSEEIAKLCGRDQLHYYDAASPIVAADSIDRSKTYEASRYGKGDGADYLNIPLDRDQYERLARGLVEAQTHEPHGFEQDAAAGKVPFFEACLPVEEMARRGIETLRFGPLKPVGLGDPRNGKRPHAVVQLRRENAAGTAYNMVGFQTRLTWPAQKAVFGSLPGLQNAEFLRLGVMHRNTFVDAPRVLNGDLSLRAARDVFMAGQVTGCEGYVEAAATGIVAAINAVRRACRSADEAVAGPANTGPFMPPNTTAIGALLAYLRDETSVDFQPQSVSFAYFAPLPDPPRDKKARRRAIAERALRDIDHAIAGLSANA